MHRALATLFLASTLGTAWGCGGTTVTGQPTEDTGVPEAGPGPETGLPDSPPASDVAPPMDQLVDQRSGPRIPLRHVPSPNMCDPNRGPGTYDSLHSDPFDSGHNCGSDSECTAGVNGRCTQTFAAGPFSRHGECTYDECSQDSQCANACACRGSVFGLPPTAANSCLPSGNCHVDADCGVQYCSPSGSPCINLGIVGLFCHTADDECVDDGDCFSVNPKACYYDTVVRHWRCSILQCLDGSVGP